jgi:hypothetical protein
LVFKCLTDTIMLDDFKTELKRLGVKRMRHDEFHRRSVALVATTDPFDDKDDDGHMEFSHALNMDPTKAGQERDDSPDPNPRFGRPRQESVATAATTAASHHQADTSSSHKEPVGKAGKKITRLPGLKELVSFKPSGRKKSKSGDEEKGTMDDEQEKSPAAAERLSRMRKSLGVVDHDTR